MNRKLTLLYLANDIVQNSKRKGPEFKSEFAKALPRALHLVAKQVHQEYLATCIKLLYIGRKVTMGL